MIWHNDRQISVGISGLCGILLFVTIFGMPGQSLAQRDTGYGDVICPHCSAFTPYTPNYMPTVCRSCQRPFRESQPAATPIVANPSVPQTLATGLLGAFLGAVAASGESDNSQQIEQERQRRILEEIHAVEDANQQRKALRQVVTLQRLAREAANQQTDEEMKSALDDAWMLISIDNLKNQPAAPEAGNPDIVDLRETNNPTAALPPDPSQPTNTGILAKARMFPTLLRRPAKNPAPIVTWITPELQGQPWIGNYIRNICRRP